MLVPAAEPLARGGWTHLVAPDDAELERVVAELGVPSSLVRHGLDADELARVDHDPGGALLVVLRIPARSLEPGDTHPGAHAVGVILVGDGVLTATLTASPLFDELARAPNFSVRPRRFVLELLNAAAVSFMAQVGRIDHIVERIQHRLHRSLGNHEIVELLRYQKRLVFFATALRSNALMLERLTGDERLGPMAAGDADLAADVTVELRQAIQLTAISSEILGQLMDAFATIVSNNLNTVMKVLTSLTLILALPNLVASIYGMNVALPGQDRAWAFAATMAVAFVVAAAVAFWFRVKRWL